MSLTSYRAAPPRVRGEAPGIDPGGLGRMGWRTWRRPTLPCLETQYHGRWGFSRPSSGWDRVHAPRQSHQVVQPIRSRAESRFWLALGVVPRVCCVPIPGSSPGDKAEDDFHAWCHLELYRAIRTGQLRALPPLHTRPINVMVYHGPRGDLVSRWVSRLDAFSGYPVRT